MKEEQAVSALVSWNCCDEVPKTGQLPPQECTTSHPRGWKARVLTEQVSEVGWGPSFSLVMNGHAPVLVIASQHGVYVKRAVELGYTHPNDLFVMSLPL